MSTEGTTESLAFQAVAGREVVARFDGGTLTSDGGALLLRETDRATGLLARFAACFTAHRDSARVTHTVEALVRQRVYGLALGYEDLNDHDALRHDPSVAVLAESADLAAHARYKKITVDHDAVDWLFVDVSVQAHPTPLIEIVLDLDATDDPVHGAQEGRFFDGYYGHYCYLPFYIFAGEHLLCARLRPAKRDASAGAIEEVDRIVAQLRTA